MLERLGAGGMGVVHAAYDPELDRRVALKLIEHEARGPDTVARFLREARAMARLDHPNVVPIHDVGEYEGGLYIAMACMPGGTLRAELASRQRSWREVVGLFRAAARGLAAAHVAGLVHRDFKPENVLIDERGTVRVTDFGLAKVVGEVATVPEPEGAGTDPELTWGATMGTPAYMSPEQLRGDELTPRSDQFSFCVSLWEALYGARPFAGDNAVDIATNVLAGRRSAPPSASDVPGWLRRVVERGLAVEPDARWPNMDRLADELGRDPARMRKRVLGSVVLVAAGGVGMYGYAQLAADRCPDPSERLAGVWDDAQRRAVRESFLGTGASFAVREADLVDEALDLYAARWVELADATCPAHDAASDRSERLLALTDACLEERRTSLAALVGVLVDADAAVVARAHDAAAALPSLEPCADPRSLLAAAPPPEDPIAAARAQQTRSTIAAADALREVGRFEAALARANEALAEATASELAPVIADALRSRGRALQEVGRFSEARTAYLESWHAALRSGADETAFEAAVARARLEDGELADREVAQAWARHAESLAVRLARDAPATVEQARRATLERLQAGIAHNAADFDTAIARAKAAADLHATALGTESVEVSHDLALLGHASLFAGRLEEAERAFGRSMEIRIARLGERHPFSAEALASTANVLAEQGRLDEAIDRLREAHAVLADELGPRHPATARAQYNLGATLRDAKRPAEALVALEQARAAWVKTFGERHPLVASADNAIGNALADIYALPRAREHYERALATREAVYGSRHPLVADTKANLATILDDLGEAPAAVALLEVVLDVRRQTYGPTHPHVGYALANLGLASRATGDLDGAVRRLEEAASILARARGPEHPDVARVLGILEDVRRSSPSR